MPDEAAPTVEMSVDVVQEDHVAVVTLNRPAALNAFSSAFLRLVHERLQAVAQDDAVQCVVITGAGEKAFCAGADIKEMAAIDPWLAREFGARGHALMRLVETMPKPVIAAVNGVALGGGCELALACDFRIANDRARFGLPEVGLGIPPGWGGTQRLPRLVGPGLAKELIYTGRILQAQEAAQIGLVNRVVPGDELSGTVRQLAGQIAGKAPLAVRVAKQAINAGLDGGIDAGLLIERDVFALCFSSRDQREGMAAFVERRAAAFEGR